MLSTVDNPYMTSKGRRTHDKRRSHHDVGTTQFVGIDGEGINTPSGEHRYVLLGCGDDQIDNPKGLHWSEIIPFLYEHYQPRTGFTGFYLGYDFTQWLKTLPEERAWRLLTHDGRESRRSKSSKMHGKFLPVDIDNWQLDMLGSKRLSVRYKPCDCPTIKCDCEKGPWLYICDSGPFFQTSFLNVIDPKNWKEPIVSDDEYRIILEGKAARDSATLDADMRRYMALEIDVLQRVMHDLNVGFQKLDINLSGRQWYGPGQSAQAWMRGRAPKRTEISGSNGKDGAVPEWFLDAARASYFGGWFELMCHGIIPGTCYENDINNAYPFIISQLPCLLHGNYSQGTGKPTVSEGEICLVRALVWTCAPDSNRQRCNAIGAMLHRDAQARISRPLITSGWYWYHELQAAQRAKCITRITTDRYYEWVKYTPCSCLPPLRRARNLYQMRLDVGKTTSLGKSCKTVNNSIYGKTAQSTGVPQYANPVYASLITAGCRTMILDAIASHPGGKQNVVMVATDAVFFLDPHPLLAYGSGLGEWETKPREQLTLFKPGVYWDDDTRRTIRTGDSPVFKARGISARDFAGTINRIDEIFASWGDNPPEINSTTFTPEELEAMGEPSWPKVHFTSRFAMTTALQALIRNDWVSAGTVDRNKPLVQNANPEDKRRNLWLDANNGRPIYRSEPLYAGANAMYRRVNNYSEWEHIPVDKYDSIPYEKRFGIEDPFSDESLQAFGVSPDEHEIGRGMFRLLTGQER